MRDARFFQDQLLAEADRKFGGISTRTKEAFLRVPRHAFVPRFSVDYETWLTNTPENYFAIYHDGTLMLHAEGDYVSTISQPSFVLKMLDLLELGPGQSVFELGAGSGWNAALMGEIVGPTGRVVSFEIIPEMARLAKENVDALSIRNVDVRHGDALAGLKKLGPFDRGIFTAGARDFPGFLFDAVRDGGVLLFVLGGERGDVLLCLRKVGNHFESFRRMSCRFVKVTGNRAPQEDGDLTPVIETTRSVAIYPKGASARGERFSGQDVDYFIAD